MTFLASLPGVIKLNVHSDLGKCDFGNVSVKIESRPRFCTKKFLCFVRVRIYVCVQVECVFCIE